MARSRSATIRDHPAFRADLQRASSPPRGTSEGRVPGCLRPDPRRGERRRESVGRRALPRHPRLRLGVRPFRSSSDRTILAHGVHLSEAELELSESARPASHLPELRSLPQERIFPLTRIMSHGIPVGLGSDIGAGTSPSLFNAMADAYKGQQDVGSSLAGELSYLATLGGAHALSLDDVTGSLGPVRCRLHRSRPSRHSPSPYADRPDRSIEDSSPR